MMDVPVILRALGIGQHYKGYRFACYSLQLVLQDETRLYNIKQHVMLPVADICGSSYAAVERDLRTVVQRAWAINPAFLRQMAGYPLLDAPTVLEFLEIVSNYVLRSKAARREQPPAEGQMNLLTL